MRNFSANVFPVKYNITSAFYRARNVSAVGRDIARSLPRRRKSPALKFSDRHLLAEGARYVYIEGVRQLAYSDVGREVIESTFLREA